MATKPPEINRLDECVFNCIVELSSSRNMNGNITMETVLTWGMWNNLSKEDIRYYWDVIRVAENELHKWHSKRTT